MKVWVLEFITDSGDRHNFVYSYEPSIREQDEFLSTRFPEEDCYVSRLVEVNVIEKEK